MLARRHSIYQGYEIYYRSDIKRLPWVVLIYPEENERGRSAARNSIEACWKLIDAKICQDMPREDKDGRLWSLEKEE
jgi:hypothetical protein